MPNRPKTDAEKAMAANARSPTRQGLAADEAIRKRVRGRRTSNPPPGTDHTGPGEDPAEGKR